jgi:mannose-1-phosphate guanylyltransferase
MPKQFAPLFGDESLFQRTVKRNGAISDSMLIVSNAEQYFLALDQLEAIDRKEDRFLLEPVGRNTASAIALAALSIPPEEIMLVVPSDHLIKKQAEYERATAKATEFAQDGFLVTFGIKPKSAETAYGYIEAAGSEVISFKEKPDKNQAEEFIKRDNFYWNSGMFCFAARTYLDALRVHNDEILKTCEAAIKNAKKEGRLIRVAHSDMMKIPENSIDYAVMEKASGAKVVFCDPDWSDMGSFESLYSELEKDSYGNTLSNAITIDSRNNLILAQKRQIAAIDVENLMIADTADALLVAKYGSGQKVKEIVKALKMKNSDLPNLHATVHRPWGTYTVLESHDRYKIKKIVVKPGKRLSLQKHLHRSEHWIVVSGAALIAVEDKTLLLRPNESTYIHSGHKHRLENQGHVNLVVIEVQVGEYLGEDDIVRFEDDFNR